MKPECNCADFVRGYTTNFLCQLHNPKPNNPMKPQQTTISNQAMLEREAIGATVAMSRNAAQPKPDLPNKDVAGTAQRLPSNWHDCDVAERQILELQRERNEAKAHAERLAEALKDATSRINAAADVLRREGYQGYDTAYARLIGFKPISEVTIEAQAEYRERKANGWS